jgi:putative FmdB family regulatory protein
MPTYDFECEPCAYYTEIFQHVNDPSVHKCPVCEQETLKKVFISPPTAFVRGEPKSIGQLADRNTAKLGMYELQEKRQKDNNSNKDMSPEQREKRKTHQKIVSMSPEQRVRYVKTGEMPK